VAFHVPLRVAGLVLFEPHPTKVRPTASTTAAANCFYELSLVSASEGAFDRCQVSQSGGFRTASLPTLRLGTQGGADCCRRLHVIELTCPAMGRG
jgi:hypothetical protein